MNGQRRVMGWGALGCSNLTTSRPGMNGRRRVARDVIVLAGEVFTRHPRFNDYTKGSKLHDYSSL